MDQSREWNVYLPWIGTAVAVAYAVYVTLTSKEQSVASDTPINADVKKHESKVVDSIDIEDMSDKTVFCRCWKSKKFPYCDGSHNQHNEKCKDNVGPLIIQRKGA